MTSDEIRNKILSLIEIRQGIKGTDLITTLMGYDLGFTNNQFMDIIFDMVAEGDICEIEYIMGGTSKSFLVPRNTKINIINKARIR